MNEGLLFITWTCLEHLIFAAINASFPLTSLTVDACVSIEACTCVAVYSVYTSSSILTWSWVLVTLTEYCKSSIAHDKKRVLSPEKNWVFIFDQIDPKHLHFRYFCGSLDIRQLLHQKEFLKNDFHPVFINVFIEGAHS